MSSDIEPKPILTDHPLASSYQHPTSLHTPLTSKPVSHLHLAPSTSSGYHLPDSAHSTSSLPRSAHSYTSNPLVKQQQQLSPTSLTHSHAHSHLSHPHHTHHSHSLSQSTTHSQAHSTSSIAPSVPSSIQPPPPPLPPPLTHAHPQQLLGESPNGQNGVKVKMGGPIGADPKSKPHICTVCNRAFTTGGHLQRHQRIHTGVKAFKCPFAGCETRTSRQDNLQQQ